MSEQTRKAFEEWISNSPYERCIDRHPNDPTRYAWTGQYVNNEIQVAWEAWCEALRQPCITRVSTEHGGKAFSIYLRDHQRISVGRTIQTKGQAWLEIQKEAQVLPA